MSAAVLEAARTLTPVPVVQRGRVGMPPSTPALLQSIARFEAEVIIPDQGGPLPPAPTAWMSKAASDQVLEAVHVNTLYGSVPEQWVPCPYC